jgi:hypothetical protein
MDKREKNFRKWIEAHVGPHWHMQCHEDKYTPGIPDISFGATYEDSETIYKANGFIELKAVKEYTRDKPIKVAHFTAQQATWLERRGRYGGNTWLLILVGDVIYLIGYLHSRLVRSGEMKHTDLEAISSYYCKKADFNRQEFIKTLTMSGGGVTELDD